SSTAPACSIRSSSRLRSARWRRATPSRASSSAPTAPSGGGASCCSAARASACGRSSRASTSARLGAVAPAELLLRAFGADDRHEAHALPRKAAQVVRQAEAWIRDLTRAGLAAELEPALVHHAEPRGADGMPERLEAAVGIDGQPTLEIEEAV